MGTEGLRGALLSVLVISSLMILVSLTMLVLSVSPSIANPAATIIYNKEYDGADPIEITYFIAVKPKNSWVENQPNPNRVLTTTPKFSAIFITDNASRKGDNIYIQVGTSENGSDMWDSGWIDIMDIDNNVRSEDVTYAGSALSAYTTYHYRIKFQDDAGDDYDWSDDQTFELVNLDDYRYYRNVQISAGENDMPNENGGNAVSTFEFSSSVEKLWTYENPNNYEIFEVEMSEDGEYIAMGSYQKEVKFFSKEDNTPLWSDILNGSVGAVFLSNNGQYITAGGGTQVKFYDNTGTVLWDYSHSSTIAKKTVKMSGDGEYVTAGGYGGEIMLFKGKDGDGTPIWTYKAGDRIRETAISEEVDGKYRIAAVSHDGKAYFFDNDDNVPVWTCETKAENVMAVDTSDNGDYIVVAGLDNRVYLFDNVDNVPIWIYEFTDNTYFLDYHMFFTVSISDNGQYIAAGLNGGEGGYFLFSKDDNTPIWSYIDQEARDVKISGDGARIVGGGWSGRVFYWGRNDNIPIWYYGEAEGRPGALAISGDGSLVMSSDADYIHLPTNGSFAYDLLTEGQLNPRRVLTYTPEFSFKLPSRRIENTVKFRIEVGIHEADSSMWNSTWSIENDENEIYINYAGSTLSPYITYWWRVRLIDNENNLSPWSVSRTFEIVDLLDFSNYRELSFTGSISDNHQVKVVIDNATNMDENFKDLLFYDGTYPNVGLPYWIENYNKGENAVVWIKVHDNNSVKLCYGNDNAKNASNGNNTFPLFENFDGAKIDFRQWTNHKFLSPSDGELSLTNDRTLWSNERWGTNWALRTRANIANSTQNLVIGFVKTDPKERGGAFADPSARFYGKENKLILRTGLSSYCTGEPLGESTTNSAYADYLGTYTIYELKRIGTDNVELWANDDNLVLSNSTSISTALVPVFFQAPPGTGTLKIDWVFLRKSSAIEPSATIGSQETWGWKVGWLLVESWDGTIQASDVKIIVETWSGTVEAYAQWNLVEYWTGAIGAPAEWQLIETWTGTVEAPPWIGTAIFSLLNLYTINVEKILDLENGSKLVVKFCTYGGAFENENVIENFSPPWHVEENEDARHPNNVGVKKAVLVLTTDNTEDVISTIASFTVRRDNLIGRISQIKSRWPYALPPERGALISEISSTKSQWPFAPS